MIDEIIKKYSCVENITFVFVDWDTGFKFTIFFHDDIPLSSNVESHSSIEHRDNNIIKLINKKIINDRKEKIFKLTKIIYG